MLFEEISRKHRLKEAWLKEGDKDMSFFHQVEDSLNKVGSDKGEGVSNLLVCPLKSKGWCLPIGLTLTRLETGHVVGVGASFLQGGGLQCLVVGLRVLYSLLIFSLELCLGGSYGFSENYMIMGDQYGASMPTALIAILKKGEVENLKDYKPISLVGSLYKFQLRCLANNSRKVLVSINQKCFYQGK